jgi:hypothetical protein
MILPATVSDPLSWRTAIALRAEEPLQTPEQKRLFIAVRQDSSFFWGRGHLARWGWRVRDCHL